MIQRQTSLSANIVAFCRYLRQEEFNIGPAEEKDCLLALQLISPFERNEYFKLSLQATLCRTPAQLKKFGGLYDLYWKELDRAVDSKISEEEEKQQSEPDKKKKQAPGIEALKSWLYGNRNTEKLETATFSEGGTGQLAPQVDFSQQELREVFQLVKKLVQKIANRRSRRFQKTKKKAILDLGRSMRKNIYHIPDIIEIIYKTKKKDHIRVLLLCDVSRSMELYSRFFIQFIYAFHALFSKVETFVFATHLHHISKEMNLNSVNKSLEEIIRKVPDWSGGTRIGSSLAQFNEAYSHKYLNRKTLVLVLSDGWDTDEVDLVGENMKKISRKALGVIWLNPLAGREDWLPEVRGMKAALPYIDALLPFYNTESLKEVVKKLKI